MKKSLGKLFFMFAFLLGTMFAVMSCSDDEEIDDITNDGTGLNALTPDQEKQNLENIGISLSNEIVPAYYQQLIVALVDFDSLSSNSALSLRSAELRSTTQSLQSVIVENDLSEMMDLLRAGSIVDDYYTKMYASYSYNTTTMQWDSTGNATALVFNYVSQGQQAQISLQVSSDYYSFQEGGQTIYVPKTFNYYLKLGSTKLMTCTVNVPTFNRTTGVTTANGEVSVPAANLIWYASTNVTSALSTGQAGVRKGSVNLISASGTITGSNMSTDTVYTEAYADNFKKATAKINVKDRLYCFAECSDFAAYVAAVESVETQYPRISSSNYVTDTYNSTYTSVSYRPELYYKEMADLINQYFPAYFNYDNSAKQVGKLFFDYTYDVHTETYTNSYGTPPYVYTYTNIYTDDYSEIIPGIQFVSDGSKFKISDYFNENDFATFITSIEDLANTFEGYVNK